MNPNAGGDVRNSARGIEGGIADNGPSVPGEPDTRRGPNEAEIGCTMVA